MECYIVGAGDFYGFEKKPSPCDYVIAADGGLTACRKEGITPDLILGDFDSLGTVPEGENVLQVPVEKDDTDMMLAVKQGLERGCRKFYLYGGTGGRLDHTIANLQTLLYLAQHGAEGWLYDKMGKFTVLQNGALELAARPAGIFSVFAMNGDAKGISICGGQYCVENATFAEGLPMGVSNHFMGKTVTIEVLDGTLLIGVLEE